MKFFSALISPMLLFSGAPAVAHTGNGTMADHSVEHLLIGLIIAVAISYGVNRFLAYSKIRHQ